MKKVTVKKVTQPISQKEELIFLRKELKDREKKLIILTDLLIVQLQENNNRTEKIIKTIKLITKNK